MQLQIPANLIPNLLMLVMHKRLCNNKDILIKKNKKKPSPSKFTLLSVTGCVLVYKNKQKLIKIYTIKCYWLCFCL
jgi:uncharacterized OsmC-like protein